ncbi:glutaminase A [Pontibacter sp. G13]|uniref:glutaminase A n=1 Tax=Pontibacter sp. G13 TaxID=3074898 RepID=UPI00288C6053|nr:glutaminase A [Pontibacter sp. G13]WNJ18189.1 glutaminase A [Pontibacter sp. G13]
MKKPSNLLVYALIWLLVVGTGSNLSAQSKKEIKKRDAAIQEAIDQAYDKYKDLDRGKNADYIPVLANVPSDLFGIVVVTPDGQIFQKGDVDHHFSIQSISKAFVLAYVTENRGPQIIEDSIGVNPTGQAFNSILPIEQHEGKGINPLVNPGAIATTSLIHGGSYDEKFNKILTALSDFAGHDLDVDQEVYESEAATNERNRSIAMLLDSYGRIYDEPMESTDIYTKQCAISVDALDLGVMAGTLANGGVNPVTGKQVVSSSTVSYVLPIMTVAGLYDNSGFWLYNVGVPAKSGVGGGLIAVVPGKFGIAAFAPPLDEAGNSVKAQMAIYDIIKTLRINPYLIEPSKN